MVKRLKIAWLRWRVKRLYKLYHQSFEDNLLEAQATHQLPRATVAMKQRLNRAIDQLRRLDPACQWPNFS